MNLATIGTHNSDFITVITDATWEEYQNIQLPNCLISYLHNVITIMSPGRNHEIIGDLIRAIIWGKCRKDKIPLFTFNQTRLTHEEKEGKEPDVAYCFNKDKDKPDLAVEINITSGSINDLTKYQYLGIAEVWIWSGSEIQFYEQTNNGYKQVNCSKFFLGLSPDSVTSIVNNCFGKDLLEVEQYL